MSWNLDYDNMDNWTSIEWCMENDALDYPEDARYEDEPQERIWIGDYLPDEDVEKARKILSIFAADPVFGQAIAAAGRVYEWAMTGNYKCEQVKQTVITLLIFARDYDYMGWMQPTILDWYDGLGDEALKAKEIVVDMANLIIEEIRNPDC